MSDVLHHTPAETAKIIRAELKRVFPDVKFRVTSERGWNGSTVNVHWTLGPTGQDVHAVVGKYATEGYFDGLDEYNPERPIEIETPEGPRQARFVKYVLLHRQKVPPTN